MNEKIVAEIDATLLRVNTTVDQLADLIKSDKFMHQASSRPARNALLETMSLLSKTYKAALMASDMTKESLRLRLAGVEAENDAMKSKITELQMQLQAFNDMNDIRADDPRIPAIYAAANNILEKMGHAPKVQLDS